MISGSSLRALYASPTETKPASTAAFKGSGPFSTAAARATDARDTPINSPAWLNVVSPLSVQSRLASNARCDASRWRRCTFTDITQETGSIPGSSSRTSGTTPTAAQARTRFLPSINWSPLTTTGSRNPCLFTSSTRSSNSRPDMIGKSVAAR